MTDNNRILIDGMTPEELIFTINKKIPKWFQVLNNRVGYTSFAIGIGCLGTDNPRVYTGISLVFIIAVMVGIKHYFPDIIKNLRAKKDKTEIEEVLLKGIEAHFLSIRKSFREVPIYWIGYLFLISILFGLNDFITNIISYLK